MPEMQTVAAMTQAVCVAEAKGEGAWGRVCFINFIFFLGFNFSKIKLKIWIPNY